MFFFDDPFDYDPLDDFFSYRYNRPRRANQYRPRNPYYDTIEDRLNQVLREEFGLDPYHHIDIARRAQRLQHLRDVDAQDHSELKERVENEAREDRGADIPPSEPRGQAPPPPPAHQIPQQRSPYRSYFYTTNSLYDGNRYVEEHREKVTDSDGKVHQTTRRRLGDRWYEAESTTDADGKTSSKETWHNVPENEQEQFKNEWAQHHEHKYALKHEGQNEEKQ